MIQASLVAAYEKEAALKAAQENDTQPRITWGPFIGVEHPGEDGAVEA